MNKAQINQAVKNRTTSVNKNLSPDRQAVLKFAVKKTIKQYKKTLIKLAST